jgi:hypothetical protein
MLQSHSLKSRFSLVVSDVLVAVKQCFAKRDFYTIYHTYDLQLNIEYSGEHDKHFQNILK